MVYNIAVCITCFLEMLVSYIFFSQIGERKMHYHLVALIGTIIFETGAFFNIFLSNLVWFNVLYFLIINFLFAVICFKIKISRAFFYSILLDAFSNALEFISIFIISAFTGTKTTEYLNNILFFVLDVTVSKTLYFLTCIILVRFVNREKTAFKFPIGLYFYPLTLVAVLIVFWNVCTKAEIAENFQITIAILCCVLFISIIALFFSYQKNIEKENKLLTLQNELNINELDRTYYKILENQNQELKIYAHDAKKHLSAIQELNDNPQIDKYIVEMTNRLKAHASNCNSGNKTLDVVINKYCTECKLNGINFNFNIKLSNLKCVENYDLVSVLSNAMDNAVEAAKNSEKRSILLETKRINNFDVLSVSNSCDNEPKIINKNLFTVKADKTMHGLGTKSIKNTLKKYNGDFEWNYNESERIFTTTIMFENPAIKQQSPI